MKELGIWIVSVSSYADDGRLMQYHKLLMPPPVFGVLKSLVHQAFESLHLEGDVFCVNERVEVGEEYISNIASRAGYRKKLVFLSAKTFELPRAIDIARRLKRGGVDAVIGGAGVTLADWRAYDLLRKEGIQFAVGEGEEIVERIIEDAVSDLWRAAYWQRDYVDLRTAPLPSLPDLAGDGYRFTFNRFTGIDTSEGCPHGCSFCCVTTLRGRKMVRRRARDPEGVREWIEKAHRAGTQIMLLDDNFRRSPIYQDLSESLSKLNKELRGRLYLFAQVDASPDIIQEIPRLALMGVKQAFLGIESLDVATLASKNKNHNNPGRYREIVGEFHKHGIFTNAGWMIGFSDQTAADMLREALAMSKIFDLVSTFRVTPLSGSEDFFEAVSEGEIIDWDPNNYDSAHFVRKLHGMSLVEAQRASRKAFRIVHSIPHMLGGVFGLRWRTFRNNFYCRAIAEWGVLRGGTPLHFMMNGIPRVSGPFVWRPKNSFRGVPLTTADLERKEEFLSSLIF